LIIFDLVSKVSISKIHEKSQPHPGPPHGVSIPAMICVGVAQSVPSNLAVELFTSHGAHGEMLDKPSQKWDHKWNINMMGFLDIFGGFILMG
jgi:hypothetical protein